MSVNFFKRNGPDLALYQPEIAQNTGTLLRTCACFDIHLHLIRPCGFPISDARLKRAAMDYLDHAHFTLHDSWEYFQQSAREHNKHLVLATPQATKSYTSVHYDQKKIILLGRESDGVPESVASACEEHCAIPMIEGVRSLNVAISGAIILSEALRQQGCFDA